MFYRSLGEQGPHHLVPSLDGPRWPILVRPRTITTWQGVEWQARYE